MPYFTNIGSAGGNIKNKSRRGSRGYYARLEGNVVTIRWGGVTVFKSREFTWRRGAREKTRRFRSAAEAQTYYRMMTTRLVAPSRGYTYLAGKIRGFEMKRAKRFATQQATVRKAAGKKPPGKAGIVRAISIRQPYVELILRGIKKEEYRSRATAIRERVYIYASLKPADDDEAWRRVRKEPGSLPSGVIVGTVEIDGCHEDSWGEYAYSLKNPKRLKRPLKARNQPQPIFWRPKFG